jgi:predicted acylesterase/phospholipase RssA
MVMDYPDVLFRWARKCTFFTRGSMTFKEAYLRTGRILNISVIPADRHSPTKLLNYVTAPDTVIWSALLASAAVPGILNPVVLMQKLKDGSIIPWNWGSRFKDGSLRYATIIWVSDHPAN